MHSLLSSTEFFNFDRSPKSKYLPSSNPVDASRTPAESIDTLDRLKASICLPQTRLMRPGRQQNQSILWQWYKLQRKGALSSSSCAKKKAGGETPDSEAAKL